MNGESGVAATSRRHCKVTDEEQLKELRAYRYGIPSNIVGTMCNAARGWRTLRERMLKSEFGVWCFKLLPK